MIILSAFLLLLALAYAILLLLYRKAWKALPSYHSAANPALGTAITVVIPARNEENNLPALLRDLQHQSLDHSFFEVLVVNDHSTDNTAEIVQGSGGNIRLVNLADHISEPVVAYKKKAIETAIGLSKGNIIVTTDADCRVKKDWLKTIACYFKYTDCQFLVMPVVMGRSTTFFQVFQTLDFMSLQGITGAAVFRRWHYMCNGANLAYTRNIFNTVEGFSGIDHIASGDDMLLMEKVGQLQPESIHYLKHEDVIVETATAPGIKAFLRQRARWAGKAGHYKDSRIVLALLLVFSLNISLVILPLVALIFRTPLAGSLKVFLFSWVAAFLIKLLLEIYFLVPVSKFFNRTGKMKYFPLAQPFHILYTVVSGFLGFSGKQDWKGRKV